MKHFTPGRNLLVAIVVMCIALACVHILIMLSGSEPSPVQELTVWHAYNGAKKQYFDDMIDAFNESVGFDTGIHISTVAKAPQDQLSLALVDAVDGRIGAEPMPDIFSAYADGAYPLYQKGLLANLSGYLSAQQWAQYIPGYLAEGEFEPGKIFLMPVIKAVEFLYLNETDWDDFSHATGIGIEGLATWEGIADIARQYYEWTDSLTDVPDDGKAFFGLDAMDHYMLLGSLQLGQDLFTIRDNRASVNADKRILRKLWDHYYVPYINGHYTAIGRYCSDDAKTGDIIAFVGSATSAAYFPQSVVREDLTQYPIEGLVYAAPTFAGNKPYAISHGAGMAVTKSTKEREQAAMTFLTWFTESAHSIYYCVGAGTLPVTKDANRAGYIQLRLDDIVAADTMIISPTVRQGLLLGAQTVTDRPLYNAKPFYNAQKARAILNESMQRKADADRSAISRLMLSGERRQDAIKRFDTDENFEIWYAAFVSSLTQSLKEPLERF